MGLLMLAEGDGTGGLGVSWGEKGGFGDLPGSLGSPRSEIPTQELGEGS